MKTSFQLNYISNTH